MGVIAYKMVSENCKITLNKVCKYSEIEVLYTCKCKFLCKWHKTNI